MDSGLVQPFDSVGDGRFVAALHFDYPRRAMEVEVATLTIAHERITEAGLERCLHVPRWSNAERLSWRELPQRVERGVMPPHEPCEHCS